MYCIYKINFPNNKVYIGKTNSFIARRNQHLSSAKLNEDLKVYRAMRKYKITKKDFEIIEDNISTNEESCLREIYWISFYDSYHNGYNSTLGGEAGSGKRGETHPLSKLTDKIVTEIRTLKATKKYQLYEIYEQYSFIPKSTFNKIWTYQTWKHILPEYNTKEYANFYRHLRKNAIGEKGSLSHFTNEEVYNLRVIYFTTEITFKNMYSIYGKGICRSSFQRLLYGMNYSNVEMPKPNEVYRAKMKNPTIEEIKELVKLYKSGIDIENLKAGIFRFYTIPGLKKLIDRNYNII